MTEQLQSRIESTLSILMDIPAAAREAALNLAKQIADMETGQREELERAFHLIKKYAVA